MCVDIKFFKIFCYMHGCLSETIVDCEACHVSRLSSRSFSHWTAAWLVAAGFRSGAAQAGLSAPGRKWELLCPRTHFYEVNTLNTEHGTRNTVVYNPPFLTFPFHICHLLFLNIGCVVMSSSMLRTRRQDRVVMVIVTIMAFLHCLKIFNCA